ncbi:MAG: histidine kinase [Verrucomicrobiota bacterium]|jgi:hypothetical protein
MDRASILRSLPRWSLISIGVWTALGLVMAAQLVMAGTWEWAPAFRWVARDWAPWVALTPLILALGVWFPFEKDRWRISLPLHVAAAIGVVMLCDEAQRWLPTPHAPPLPNTAALPGGPGTPPSPRGPLAPRQHGPEPAPRHPDGPPRGPGPGRGGRVMGFVGGAFSMRARLNFPLYWVLVSVSQALLFYRRSQDRERRALELAASLAQARLHALRMQLQPHFLFNTLHAIATLVHENPHAADDMIASLSDFLRMTLERGDRPEQPLRDELEFIERYLSIERIRFGDRLAVRHEIDATTLGVHVPTLVLQPLVENAIRHGLEPRREPGVLTLVARREGPDLILAVSDNGVGIAAGERVREGVGLANTRARLGELYGARAALDLHETPGGGTTVTVRLPAHMSAPSNAVPPAP